MILDGMIQTKCPPEAVVQLLLSPPALRDLLPAGCEVGERTGDTVPFVIRRKVGPINLSMAGTLSVKINPAGDGDDLVIQAAHMVAGRFKVTLLLRPSNRAGQPGSLSWIGQLESHGLAARLIEDRAARVRSTIRNMFNNLAEQA